MVITWDHVGLAIAGIAFALVVIWLWKGATS